VQGFGKERWGADKRQFGGEIGVGRPVVGNCRLTCMGR